MNNQLKIELDKLCSESNILLALFALRYSDDEKILNAVKTRDDYESIKNKLFEVEYQKWYNKSLIILKSISADRLDEFKSYYLPAKNRKTITIIEYTISDAINGYLIGNNIKPFSAHNKLYLQTSIIKSLKALFDSKLIEISKLLSAELFEKEIDSASHLLKLGYIRSAGAICGVLLEKKLDEIAKNNSITFAKKDPALNDYIQTIYENGVFDADQYKYLLYLSSIRNKCDHNKAAEPTKDEVEDLIRGTRKVIYNY